MSAGLGVARRGEDDGVAGGEAFRHGAIAGEAGGDFLHLAALTFAGWHGGERLVTAGLNAEIIVGFLRQALSSAAWATVTPAGRFDCAKVCRAAAMAVDKNSCFFMKRLTTKGQNSSY